MKFLLLMAFAALLTSPATAGGQWSSVPGENGTIPREVNRSARAYYRVTDTTDSSWMKLAKGETYRICLDADEDGTGGSTTVRVWQAISSDGTDGGYVIEDKVLTGVHPLVCLPEVHGGRSIMVEMVTAPDSTTAVISVEAE